MIIKHHFTAILIVLLFSLLIVSCASQSNIFMSGVPVVESISPMEDVELFPVDSIQGEFMDDVIGLHCIIDSVAVLHLENANYEFRALNIKSKKYVDFLRIGRGADEVISGYFSQHRIVGGVNIIDIICPNEHKLFSIDLDKTMKQSNVCIVKVTEIPKAAGLSFIIGDKRLDEIMFDSSGYMLRLVDGNNSVIREDYVFGEGGTVPRYQPLFSSYKCFKPDGAKLAMAMSGFDKINIYDIIGNDHFSISTKVNVDDKAKLSDVQKNDRFDNHYFYFSQDVNDDHIYALYYDCEWIASEFENAPTIQVFDWTGKYCKSIQINEPVNKIVVSDDESILYGMVCNTCIYLYAL